MKLVTAAKVAKSFGPIIRQFCRFSVSFFLDVTGTPSPIYTETANLKFNLALWPNTNISRRNTYANFSRY